MTTFFIVLSYALVCVVAYFIGFCGGMSRGQHLVFESWNEYLLDNEHSRVMIAKPTVVAAVEEDDDDDAFGCSPDGVKH